MMISVKVRVIESNEAGRKSRALMVEAKCELQKDENTDQADHPDHNDHTNHADDENCEDTAYGNGNNAYIYIHAGKWP